MKPHYPLIIFLFSACSLWSQTKVGGKVVDVDGQPMAYTNVMFKNSSEGTITNDNGKFYMESDDNHEALEISFTGYKTEIFHLKKSSNTNIKVLLKEDAEQLNSVQIYKGKTSKTDNPAIDILKKIWENRRRNGVNQYKQYQYDKYEKLEFDLNTIDSSMMDSRFFKDIQFIFDRMDTSAVSGKNYLPIFINESVSEVYGDNGLEKEKEVLKGNQNSGFSNNHALVDFIKDLYIEYDIYDNYLRFFNKSFTSPLSRTGVDVYNYVLADSSYIDDKWSYKIVYYPRRQNELTFQGDFWVNDTTWAIKDINLEMSKNANINWVNDVYIEQEFDVQNDSTFLLKRDHFMVNFALKKKDNARGVYGKRTSLYDNYEFNKKQPERFYKQQRTRFDKNIYNRSDEFWEEQRTQNLTAQERGTYDMLDSLKQTKTFKRFYDIGSIIGSGYINFSAFDYGPILSTFGFNEVEGLRIRVGGRTFFSPDDMWRLEGFTAYGFKDKKFKYGLSGKWMIDPISRLKILGGYRYDVEQLGASLTNTSNALDRSLASSALITVGSNKSLSHIRLAHLGFEISPLKNLKIRLEGSHRHISPASPEFNLDFYTDKEHNEVKANTQQTELSSTLEYFPKRITTNHGVERQVVNKKRHGHMFLRYSKGMKNWLSSDFNYDKLEFYYRQPLYMGSFGILTPIIEIGKTFDPVPLSLLSIVPGNQSLFTIHESFPLLDYYEFTTDSYASWHLEHDFGGRLLSYIPLFQNWNLREFVGVRGVIGSISDQNRALNASTSHPDLQAPNHNMYWSWSIGVGNIFKFFRIDAHFRGNYRHSDARKFGVTGNFEINF